MGGELPSGYLAACFHHSWPTTTRHLGVLEKAGLVEVQRQGPCSRYPVNRERLLRGVGCWLRTPQAPTPEQTWNTSGPKSTREPATPTGSKTTKSKAKGT